MKDHILVVDDDPLVRTGLAQDLEQGGYRVTTAATGADALQLLQAGPVDLVLCDLMMEGLTGLQLLQEIRRKDPELPVIILTGFASMVTAIEALRLGATDYVQKPAKTEELVHRLQTSLTPVRLRRQVVQEHQKAESLRKDLQESLLRSERMASMGVLADGIAGELNALAGPALGAIRQVLDHLPANHAARARALEAGQAVERILALGNDLLSVGRPHPPPAKALDLNQVIHAYVRSPEFEKLLSRQQGVFMELHLARTQPMVNGAEQPIRRLLANLITRALMAMPRGGRMAIGTQVRRLDGARGSFEVGQPGEYALLTVEDNGTAIEKEVLAHVFEPFVLQQPVSSPQFSGLGLALVYRIVKDCRGYINVTSTPGEGTRFTLYFPFLKAPPAPAAPTLAEYRGTETILVIDDAEPVRKIASSLLTTLGYRVLTAASGHEALRIFEDLQPQEEGPHPIDLLVLDMILGDEVDGLETYRRIVQRWPGQKAIIVSGFAETERIVKVRELGAGSFVQKPFTLDTLGRAVRAELDRRPDTRA